MKQFHLNILVAIILLIILEGCKKKEGGPAISTSGVYNYFPTNIGNEWIYAINDVYYGKDTMRVQIVLSTKLSNNQTCWQVTYHDLMNLYNDTNYVNILNDTIYTYTSKEVSSLKEKWILDNVKNNFWTGVDAFDKCYFQTPVDSFNPYGTTYTNVWNIRRVYIKHNYSDIEQLFFEANIGLCFFSVNEANGYTPVRNQQWHLIHYALN